MKKSRPPREATPRYKVRELEAADLENGFLEALENLSDVGGLLPGEARVILSSIERAQYYHILVAVADGGRILGATTLFVEQKFIHRGGLVGHIEDVAVRRGFEGMGVGGSLVNAAVRLAKELGCYKCILDCKADLVGFYQGLGFHKHDVGMRIDLRPVHPRRKPSAAG